MLLYEAEGKELLRDAGFTVPRGVAVAGAAETLDAARKIGFPCVVKAQTLSGRRWKRGLVAVVRDEADLRQRVRAMHGEPIAGFLVEERISEAAEFYVSISIEEAEGTAVLLISTSGGVDVEEATSFVKLPMQGRRAPWSFEVLDALRGAGIEGRAAAGLARAAARLAQVALDYECVLLEINPLVLTEDGTAIVIDAKIELDDDARRDNSRVVRFSRMQDSLEAQAVADDISFVRLGGEIGTIVGGAGLAMLTVDALADANLLPANFIDLQGSSSKKFIAGFQLLNDIAGIKAILTNNAGGLNPCMALAEGIVAGVKRLRRPVPVVVKLHGADEQQAWDFLVENGEGVHVCKGTTADAVRMVRQLL